jgi:hypothetical protein
VAHRGPQYWYSTRGVGSASVSRTTNISPTSLPSGGEQSVSGHLRFDIDPANLEVKLPRLRELTVEGRIPNRRKPPRMACRLVHRPPRNGTVRGMACLLGALSPAVIGRATPSRYKAQILSSGASRASDPTSSSRCRAGTRLGFAGPDERFGFGYVCNQSGRRRLALQNITLIDAMYVSVQPTSECNCDPKTSTSNGDGNKSTTDSLKLLQTGNRFVSST